MMLATQRKNWHNVGERLHSLSAFLHRVQEKDTFEFPTLLRSVEICQMYTQKSKGIVFRGHSVVN